VLAAMFPAGVLADVTTPLPLAPDADVEGAPPDIDVSPLEPASPQPDTSPPSV